MPVKSSNEERHVRAEDRATADKVECLANLLSIVYRRTLMSLVKKSIGHLNEVTSVLSLFFAPAMLYVRGLGLGSQQPNVL